jgi:DNA-binding response OmpR family regulator
MGQKDHIKNDIHFMRLLIAGGEDNVRTFIRKGLQEEGAEVFEISAYDDLLSMVRQTDPDVILIIEWDEKDIVRDAIGKIKSDPEARDIQVVLCSKIDSVELKVNWLEAGADDYITQPFAFSEILARIKSLVRAKERTSEMKVAVQLLTEELKNRNLTTEKQGDSVIIRSIEFPPEYYQAGVSLITYFGTVLRNKYPDKQAKVRIIQEGLKVVLVIETDAGGKETVEVMLSEYGEVLSGKVPIESFLDDPLQVLALKNKLDISQLEIRQAYQLLEYQRGSSEKRIASLESEVSWLRHFVGKVLEQSDSVTKALAGITAGLVDSNLRGVIASLRTIEDSHHNLKEEIALLVERLSKANPSEDDAATIEHILMAIKAKEPTIFDQLVDTFHDFSVGFSSSIWATIFLKAIEMLPKHGGIF